MANATGAEAEPGGKVGGRSRPQKGGLPDESPNVSLLSAVDKHN